MTLTPKMMDIAKNARKATWTKYPLAEDLFGDKTSSCKGSNLYVKPDGTITPCAVISEPLGIYPNTSINQILSHSLWNFLQLPGNCLNQYNEYKTIFTKSDPPSAKAGGLSSTIYVP
jgi:MoaA/NifB/PqqE/SkfB family radical SAM enzyme